LLLLFYDEKIDGLIFSEKFAIITILLDGIFVWLASVLRQDKDSIFKKIIFIISLTIWQYYFTISNHDVFNIVGILFQPLLMYGYTVEIINLILYNQKDFKRKFDTVLISSILVTILCYFINPSLFNLLYFFIFVLLHFYPLLLLVVYRSHFKQVISPVKKSCLYFAILLLFILSTEFYGDVHGVSPIYTNLGWYLFPAILGVIYYFRTIHDKFRLELKRFLGTYQLKVELAVLGFLFGWTALTYFFIKDFLLFFVITSINVLFILMALSFFNYHIAKMNERIMLLDGQRLSRFMKTEESVRQDFSNYLHDDILQNIIAVKNLLSLENQKMASQYVVEELNDLVVSIRNEIDSYHPILLPEKSLKENYQILLNELLRKRKSHQKISFNCSDSFSLLPPYDVMVYRFLKELTNNAIKYATSDRIDLSLDIQSDVIVIKEWNQSDVESVIYGRGLKSIEETLSVFGGRISTQINDNIFVAKILLPVDWKLCYENFID
jgi:two-component system secretion system sensor histidine kinase SalK